jgi:hypothetical protein
MDERGALINLKGQKHSLSLITGTSYFILKLPHHQLAHLTPPKSR